ncbi:MAG TPA: hypothetical protein VKZ49_05655 [Polyangiaceae bacterium]|nr:hypothetical protein [Polyangiaceae bacterium]
MRRGYGSAERATRVASAGMSELGLAHAIKQRRQAAAGQRQQELPLWWRRRQAVV